MWSQFCVLLFSHMGWGRRLHGVLNGVLPGEPSPPSRILSDMELLERSVIGKSREKQIVWL
jgi:hypothetical protein